MIIVLLAILLGVIATCLALAIDTARLSAAKTEHHQVAQTAAIAALEAYRNTPAPGLDSLQRHREKLAAAIDRAEAVLGQARNTLVADRWTLQVESGAAALRDGTGTLTTRNAGIHAEHAAGILTGGEWFPAEPAGGCGNFVDIASSCPCPGGAWVGHPCFRPAGPTAESITAVEVALSTRQSSPLRNILLLTSVPNQNSIYVHSRGRAAMIPRVVVFAVDLSRSITFDTHIPWDGDKPTDNPNTNLSGASEYVFQLAEPLCTEGDPSVNPCLADAYPFELSAGCQFAQHDFSHPVWYSMEQTRPDPLVETFGATKHFRDDYGCFIVGGAHYLIDVSVHPLKGGRIYRGAEPLTSVLASVRSALNEVHLRSIPGDSITLFGFRDVVDDDRRLGPTDPWTGNSDWQDLLTLTDVQNLPQGRNFWHPTILKRMEKRFFPDAEAGTDLAEALLYASQLIPDDQAVSENADYQVTVFSDFLSTCFHENGANWIHRDNEGKFQLSADSCPVPNPTADLNNVYDQTSHMSHYNAMTQAGSLVSTKNELSNPVRKTPGATESWLGVKKAGYKTYLERGIRLNTVLFGKLIQPHYLLKQSRFEPNRCLRDDEARADGRSMVAGENVEWPINDWICYLTQNTSQACEYTTVATYPRYWAKKTGGFFEGIKPGCDPEAVTTALPGWGITAENCADGELERKLDSEVCASWTGDTNPEGRDWPISHNGYPGSSNVQALVSAGVLAENHYRTPPGDPRPRIPVADPNAWWQYTRVICDLRCRDADSQVVDLIREMYNNSPYLLVRDDV